DWPSKSPDINLIEHIWEYKKHDISNWKFVGGRRTLEKALNIVWNAIQNERFKSLIRTMPECLQAIIDTRGGATQY
ncbi:transposable element Tcb2 transposase, partial [Choiromyces venosus 120613-1]